MDGKVVEAAVNGHGRMEEALSPKGRGEPSIPPHRVNPANDGS